MSNQVKYKDFSIDKKKRVQATLKRYHKTKKGFLCRLYKNMRGRVEGIQTLKAHLYLGLTLLPREEFYQWSLDSVEFNELYAVWVVGAYNTKLTPSIDRIDSRKGYILGNIRWVTHSYNSRLGANSRWKK